MLSNNFTPRGKTCTHTHTHKQNNRYILTWKCMKTKILMHIYAKIRTNLKPTLVCNHNLVNIASIPEATLRCLQITTSPSSPKKIILNFCNIEQLCLLLNFIYMELYSLYILYTWLPLCNTVSMRLIDTVCILEFSFVIAE